jgi:hypothetical protein
MMLLVDAINHVIDDGIEAARHDYAKPGDTLKREGAIAGFDECRNKEPVEICRLDDRLESAGVRGIFCQ